VESLNEDEDEDPSEFDGVGDKVEEDGDCVLARLDVPEREVVLTTLEEEFV